MTFKARRKNKDTMGRLGDKSRQTGYTFMDYVMSSKEQSLVPEPSSSMWLMPTLLCCHGEWLPMSVLTAGVW